MSQTSRPRFLAPKSLALAAAAALVAVSFASSPGYAAMSNDPAPAPQAAPKASGGSGPTFSQAKKLVKAGKYKQGLAALKALDDTGNPDVLNLMGFSSRKLGDAKNAERYYKAALKIDPKHRGALEYYGELMVQLGNAKGAMTHLASLKADCGNCEEYKDLRAFMQRAGLAVN